MKTKKIPVRTCIVTGDKLPKGELLRIVKTPTGEIVVDKTGKVNGHGVYIKKDKALIPEIKKSKILEKKLESKIEEDIYLEIEKDI